MTRADGRELRPITVYLPTDLAARLRVHCARQYGFNTVTTGRPFGDAVVPAFHWAYVGRLA